MNEQQHWERIARQLRERRDRTGIIEKDGVPKVVQQAVYSYSLFGFYVLLFSDQLLFVSADVADMRLRDRVENAHYYRMVEYVERLAAEGVLSMEEEA